MSADTLVAIKANPEHDELRRRYADALIEDRHPRGPWMHAQLDAADSTLPLEQRERQAAAAEASFIEALTDSDQRAREDFTRGRPCSLHFLPRITPAVARAEVDSSSLGECVLRLAVAGPEGWHLETNYDLRYRRGMLWGVEVRQGVSEDAPRVASVLQRAPVRRFGCPGELLDTYLVSRGLSDIHELALFGPVRAEQLVALPTTLANLRSLDLARARIDGPSADLELALAGLEVGWPTSEVDAAPIATSRAIEAPRNIRAMAVDTEGLWIAAAEGLSRWRVDPLERLEGPRLLSGSLTTFGTSQIRQGGVFACANRHPQRDETVPICVGRGFESVTMVRGGARASVDAITISEDARTVAWWEDGRVRVVRDQQRAWEAATPGRVYHDLLLLPDELGLLARRKGHVERLEHVEQVEHDPTRRVCVVPGMATPIYWPRSDNGWSQPMLVADPDTAAWLSGIPDVEVLGYSAGRDIVALGSGLGVQLYRRGSERPLAILPWKVKEVWIHPVHPIVIGWGTMLVWAHVDTL